MYNPLEGSPEGDEMNLYSIQLYDREGSLCPIKRGEAKDFVEAFNIAQRFVFAERAKNDLKDPAIKSIIRIGTKDF